MAAKLKALKVAELKDILTNAAVSFPSKATKSDLIAKINASPAALNLFTTSRTKSSPASAPPPNDDLLAPPEDVDWNSDPVDAAPDPRVTADPKVTPPKNTSNTNKSLVNASTVSHVPSNTETSAPTTAPVRPAQPFPNEPSAPQDDDELAKRKARAARFGVPLVEPPKQEASAKKTQAGQPRNTTATPPTITNAVDIPDKLAARALRFGEATPPSTAMRKRHSPAEVVDKEELERRKKRRERFGPIPVAIVKP